MCRSCVSWTKLRWFRFCLLFLNKESNRVKQGQTGSNRVKQSQTESNIVKQSHKDSYRDTQMQSLLRKSIFWVNIHQNTFLPWKGGLYSLNNWHICNSWSVFNKIDKGMQTIVTKKCQWSIWSKLFTKKKLYRNSICNKYSAYQKVFYDRIKSKISGCTGYVLSFTVIFITIPQLSQLCNLLYIVYQHNSGSHLQFQYI